MPHRKKTIGAWGGAYNAFQLSEALKTNRSEFLELCRRVTCDEVAAHSLIGLVEKVLDKNHSISTSSQFLKLSKLDLYKSYIPISDELATRENKKIDREINLIQLLAEVHLLAITNGRLGK